MTNSTEPTALLSHLHRTDGSATFSQNGYTVIGAVNGPIEVQRRDELAEEAAIDVIVRPSAGAGGIRERHLESILRTTLRQVILVHNFPRTLIQITLQITSIPENESVGSKLVQASSNLSILPALLQTATLALLSASIPLSVTLNSVFIAIVSDGASQRIIPSPTLTQIQKSESVHVLALTSHGGLLLNESEGNFSIEDWDAVYKVAERLCSDEVDEMSDDNEPDADTMAVFVKSILKDKVAGDLHWKV